MSHLLKTVCSLSLFLLTSCALETEFSRVLTAKNSLNLIAPPQAATSTISVHGVCDSLSLEVIELSGNFLNSPQFINCNSNGEYVSNIDITDSVTTITARQGNNSAQADVEYDTTPPLVTILTPASGSDLNLTETLTGDCESGLDVEITGDIINPVTTSCVSGNFSQVIELNPTPTGNRTVTVSQTDSFGNTGTDNDMYTVTAPPTGMALGVNSPSEGSSVEIGPSVTIDGFCTSHSVTTDISISGDFTNSPLTTTCSYDGNDYGVGADYGGTFSVDVVFNAAPAGGSRNIVVEQTNTYDSTTATESLTYTTDSTSPSVTLSALSPIPSFSTPLDVQVSFSESVSGLTSSDFTVINGAVANITGGPLDYVIEITPASEGEVRVTLPAGSVSDSSSNLNTVSNELIMEFLSGGTMITTWQIDDPSEDLVLWFRSGYNYNYNIDWGDGSPITSGNTSGNVSHTYTTAGTYTVTINGILESWRTETNPIETPNCKLLEVNDLGDMGWRDLGSAFRECESLTNVNGGDTSQVTNMGRMFYNADAATPDTSTWDTSQVTDMSEMFYRAIAANPDTSGWDTSQVIDMSGMFDGASAANPDTSNWDTSQVTDMSKLFSDTVLATPDTSNWDTSQVTNMSEMFISADAAAPNTSNWDTSQVINMTSMFARADAANPDTSNWDTSQVADMSRMFSGADTANPDTSNWDTSQVTDMSAMFISTTIADPNTSNWDTSQVMDMSNMFRSTSAADPDTSNWDTSQVTDMSFMFSEAGTANPDTSNWDTSQVTDMSNMFSETDMANPDTSNWDTSQVTDMSNMFSETDMANPDTSNWDTSQVMDMSFMFRAASAADPDTSNWDTSQVTDMSSMFRFTNAANPDTTNWNTSQVTDMRDMFTSADAANPDTTNWDTSQVIFMSGMFRGASAANPDTSNWDTSQVIFMDTMFFGASAANPDTSNWNTSQVTDMSSMFSRAFIANPDTSNWDLSSLNDSNDLSNIFYQTSISNTNYSNFLLRAEATATITNVTLDASAEYQPSAAVARDYLINTLGWTINDEGPE